MADYIQDHILNTPVLFVKREANRILLVDCNLNADTKLVDFLRQTALLTGTKWMCKEGGCGLCVVGFSAINILTNKKESRAVHSCLLPLLSCHGSEITTVEGIGSKKDGYHPVQSQLADMNGSQCGYCSPGMVMSMYSLLQKNSGAGVTMKEIESSLGGNICRCTGYRPIMDAFKTFAKDAPPELKSRCVDLEDLGNAICPKTGSACQGLCESNRLAKVVDGEIFKMGNWYRPESLEQLMELLSSFGGKVKYRLVAGNTGTGVYKEDGPYDVYVDINQIGDLYQISKDSPLIFGGGINLTVMQETLSSIGSTNPDYWYAVNLAEHIEKIGSVPVRNAGSIAGNLMMKHGHREFPSDLFIVLATIGAKITIISCKRETQQLTLEQFLETDMNGQIILNVTLPPLSTDHIIKTFKIMPRSCNAHAYINAGFCAKISRQENIRIVGKPTIIFGGIRSSLIHVTETENFLADKFLDVTFQNAQKVLDQELCPEEHLLNPDSDYLKTVAQGLFYKFVLTIFGDKAAPEFRSGALNLERKIMSGKQDYDIDSKEWPVNQPTIKVEARAQCSGEAKYIDDIPIRVDELYGAFVLSTAANCLLDKVDATLALKSDGVIAFFDALNINTGNVFFFANSGLNCDNNEEVFCSGKVLYAGQSLGLVVARNQKQAIEAAKLVRVTYRNHQKPVLTIKDALKDSTRIQKHSVSGSRRVVNVGDVEDGLSQSDTVVEGEFEIGSQYHFYMETLVAACVPVEDGMDVFCATQDQEAVQSAVANCLNLRNSQVNVQTRRLGGGFGGKISRSTLVAVACAIAASELSRPVRIALDLDTNMALTGGRLPYYCHYKAGVNKNGLLQAVDLKIISDCGCSFNEGTAYIAASFAKNCYASKCWKITPLLAKTDTASNTHCRAPGPIQGIAIIENLMEHLAHVRKEDPLDFRLKNLNRSDENEFSALQHIISEVRCSSNYDERHRQVNEFNCNNRWKKRGINLLPMVYPMYYSSYRYNVLVAVNRIDGSVSVSHGGIECGQGINTKVSQVVAKELGIDISLVSIKPTNTLTNTNGSVTGGSKTSELNCYAAMRACQKLKKKMLPIREKIQDDNWNVLVEKCYNSNVDLTARHFYSPKDDLTGYVIRGATVSEVEIDVLTGEKMIRRVDILEDAGLSINPLLDIGQVEGGFIMGLGLWTSEKMIYDPTTGKKLSRGTWNYYPPLNNDIPMDFRITMLKNAAHPFGVLRSKATGEPPLCMSVSVFFALRNAVNAARIDCRDSDWFRMDGPATIDTLHKLMKIDPSKFLF
ncbi:indole-3-acetaldehyde oxidase-like isoform X1 [Daphnia pulex]|uniref:indole-3-acetaldehyde oxidase-like isoform X1 n=1 Tax=Daphnia pulex TaxID=6669 RepID=UPI001EDF418E|nr:indole-3-acetaldehyde oxidase-like isoform X1 [Daphnia pulex]